MSELLIWIIIGAVIIALGLWLFQHLGLVVAVVGTLLVLGLAASLVRRAAGYVGKLFEGLLGSHRGEDRVERPTPVDNVPAALSRAERSARDELLAAAVQYRAELRAKEDEQYREHKKAIAEAEGRIAEAREFVERTSLDSALIQIMETVRHWPAWSKKPEFARYMLIPGVTEVVAEEEKRDGEQRRRTVRVSFLFDGRLYRIDFDDQGYFESHAFGEIRFYDAQRLVVTLAIARDVTREYDPWRLLEVKKLEPGDWLAGALSLENRIRMQRQKQDYQHEAERLQAQAEHLPPDRTDPLT